MKVTRGCFPTLACALVLGVHVSAVSAAQSIVIKAQSLLDIHAGKLLSPAVLVVTDDRIEAINPTAIPQDAVVFDLGTQTLLPGLMDMHTHLTGDYEGDFVHRVVHTGAADWALRGARNANKTLQAGFTTVRDLGGGFFADVALMRGIAADMVPGPDIFPAGHALGITGGHCDVTGFAPGILELGPEQGVVDGVDAVLKAVRYQIKHGARVIKICATAGVLSFEASVGAQQMSSEEIQAVVDEAHRHGIKVAAHAHGSEGILAAVLAGVDSIEHGSLLTKKIIKAMKKRGTFLVPTTYLADYLDLEALPPVMRSKAESVLPQARESVRLAVAHGVRIALGTDAGVIAHGDNAKELSAMIARGMTPLAALRSATTQAAALLGVQDRGALEVGLRADIIAVAGNPLEDMSATQNVRFVMKQGRVYRGQEFALDSGADRALR